MLVDWMIQKTGTVLTFFIISWTLYKVYLINEEYNINNEIEETLEDLTEQIEVVSNSAKEYSVGKSFSKIIELPEDISGFPYIITIDPKGSIEINLLNKEISKFTLLPKSAIINAKGETCLIISGFNEKGKVSVGIPLNGMNRTRSLKVTKGKDTNVCIEILAMS